MLDLGSELPVEGSRWTGSSPTGLRVRRRVEQRGPGLEPAGRRGRAGSRRSGSISAGSRFLRVRAARAAQWQVGEHPRGPPARPGRESHPEPAAPRGQDAGRGRVRRRGLAHARPPARLGHRGPVPRTTRATTRASCPGGASAGTASIQRPGRATGQAHLLDFDGAMAYAKVWLNGQYVGGWPYGYASSRLDLTPYVKFGARERAGHPPRHRPTRSRWYPGARHLPQRLAGQDRARPRRPLGHVHHHARRSPTAQAAVNVAGERREPVRRGRRDRHGRDRDLYELGPTAGRSANGRGLARPCEPGSSPARDAAPARRDRCRNPSAGILTTPEPLRGRHHGSSRAASVVDRYETAVRHPHHRVHAATTASCSTAGACRSRASAITTISARWAPRSTSARSSGSSKS